MGKIILSIEGNIGSGKSTLINNLKHIFRNNKEIAFVDEPVSLWESIKDKNGDNILINYYKDQKKYAFAFQMMAYISRLSLLKQAVKDNPNAIIFTERSLFTDKNVFAKMLYDDNKINHIEYTIYMEWFNEFIEDLPLAGIIYMRSAPEICFGRVIKRSRRGEHIPLDYLIKCHEYHDDWILNNPETTNVIVLNCDTDNIEFPSITNSSNLISPS